MTFSWSGSDIDSRGTLKQLRSAIRVGSTYQAAYLSYDRRRRPIYSAFVPHITQYTYSYAPMVRHSLRSLTMEQLRSAVGVAHLGRVEAYIARRVGQFRP